MESHSRRVLPAGILQKIKPAEADKGLIKSGFASVVQHAVKACKLACVISVTSLPSA